MVYITQNRLDRIEIVANQETQKHMKIILDEEKVIFSAVGKTKNGNQIPIHNPVSWVLSKEIGQLVSYPDQGDGIQRVMFLPNTTGELTLTASANGISTSIDIEIVEPSVESIEIQPQIVLI
jgi:hypothetical protein